MFASFFVSGLAVFDALFDVLAALLAVFAAGVLDAVFALLVELKSVIGGCVTGELMFGLIFEGAFASTFAFVEVAGEVSVVSGLLESTETLPVKAGIASIKADSIKTVAAIIVVFDKTVAVPREPKALLEILLVNNAPASVLPG